MSKAPKEASDDPFQGINDVVTKRLRNRRKKMDKIKQTEDLAKQ
jgi:hypothetical protein